MRQRPTNIPFYDLYTETGHVPEVYSELIFKQDNQVLYQRANSKNSCADLDGVYSISLFPSYLSAKLAFDAPKMILKTIPQKKIMGFAIEIPYRTDFETFFKQKYSKRFRSNIKRFVNRFESCFNVNYLMFYGVISKKEYEHYMLCLKKMLRARFNEKGEENRVINQWEYYYDSTYELIKSKKCSLFVIQANNEVVHVCVNRHQNKIINISIPSYDICYSKFSLGNISIYKILEWAVERNYEFIDMEYGAYDYKRRWSNRIYHFDHHLFYPSRKGLGYLLGKIEFLKLKTKNLLKYLRVDVLIKSIKQIRRSSAKTPFSAPYQHKIIELVDKKTMKALDFHKLDNTIVKRTILDIIFSKKLALSEIEIFVDSKKQNVYYLVGEKINIKIESSYHSL